MLKSMLYVGQQILYKQCGKKCEEDGLCFDKSFYCRIDGHANKNATKSKYSFVDDEFITRLVE